MTSILSASFSSQKHNSCSQTLICEEFKHEMEESLRCLQLGIVPGHSSGMEFLIVIKTEAPM